MNIQRYWYRERLHPYLIPLLPLSWAFQAATACRRFLYRIGFKKTQRLAVPVIIVGNLSAGGTGKTPFVLWLINCLKEQGKKPGIALRGVGGKAKPQPFEVSPESDPLIAGDEAVLLAANAHCPVIACTDRVAAVEALITKGCDLVICDDGLQHYRLGRDLEIAIIDGQRYFGNGQLLPAGPLREPLSRLNKIDFIIINQQSSLTPPDCLYRINQRTTHAMQLQLDALVSVDKQEQEIELAELCQQKVHALAGIGNPQRFFELLRNKGLELIPHEFPDHYHYRPEDLDFQDNLAILMTEKDAIKCRGLNYKNGIKERLWYVRAKTEVSPDLKQALLDKILAF